MKELTLDRSNYSSSSSSFTCNSSFTYNWTYDVFLNFRGKDTRNGFTGHLYHALCEKGIHTFMDDRLKRGEDIIPALLEAIDKSRIFIVILSVNYASSTFCLEELVKIFECTKQKSRLILPIFYKVEPSDVRHLRGSYQEAFVRYETQFENSEEKVRNWKSALREVADLSGWHFKEGHEYEYELVKKIVEEVSKRSDCTPLHVAKYPVGLKSPIDKVISLLDLGSNKEVTMVGIHGIGGIGKTTIACAVYNVIVDQFENACFLSNVRERSYKYGLVELQETLLSQLAAEKGIKIENIRKGIPIIRRRLCQKKVLLILDDISSQEQLEAIAGGIDWFGFGSRIIVTTRDKHLLDIHDVKRQYQVKKLCFEGALELFRWNAFKKNEVDSRYTSIINHVTNYCDGLPLALEIIGSNLFGKTQEEWKSALDIYKKIPNKNVQNILKVSYTSLEENEKEIFLDVACFFNGCSLSDVKYILLHGRGYDPEYCIGVLERKSLIKTNEGLVKIHDLMAQMGREIVRSQSPSDPGNWSRLWSYNYILNVLEEEKGSDKIEFLMLNMPQAKEVLWNGKAFKKMKNLKILIVGNAHFSCEPKYLPNSLRMLVWKNCSLSALPSDFHPRNLSILNLCGSSLRFIKLFKNFESLTEMNLSGSRFLTQVADISEAVNLRKLNISYCRNLTEVHHSVGFLDKLVMLNAYGCTKLSTFPSSIKSASLKLLELAWCISLPRVPEVSVISEKISCSCDCLSHAEVGSLSLEQFGGDLRIYCGTLMLPKLENWNDGFQHFSTCGEDDQEKMSPAMPEELTIYSGSSFKKLLRLFPTLRLNWNSLTSRYFSVWRPYYRNLTKLLLESCNLTDEFLYQRLPWFPNLIYLDLSFNGFTVLPKCMNKCHHLRTLLLNECKDLQEIRGIPQNIELLSLINCTLLTSQSSKILSRRAFHEDRSRSIVVPGFKIPEWMNHSCMGSSISFLFRDEFPRLALCFISKNRRFNIQIFINGIQFKSSFIEDYRHYSLESETPCISMGDLDVWCEKWEEVLKKDEWNHVVISSHGDLDIYYGMGVHVYKKEKSPDNIRFMDSKRCIINQNRDLICGSSLQNKFCAYQDMQVCDSKYSHKKAKSLYHKLDNDECSALALKEIDPTERAIRIMLSPTKVKVLVWRILIESLPLPTCCDLFIRKLVMSPMCPICETEFETIEHVFFKCSWTRPLWFGADLEWTIEDRWPSIGRTSWLEQKLRDIMKVHPNAKSVIGLMGSILWAIWKARNEFILKGKPVNPLETLMTAKALHTQYSSQVSTGTTLLGLHHNKSFTSIDQENVEGTKVENNIKWKRNAVRNNNTKVESCCNEENVKGVKVNYKGKQKGQTVRSRNTKMEPTCDKDNVKSAEVDYKVKPKRQIVSGSSNSNTETKPTCDKGTQVENKAKRKREEDSSDNTEVNPSWDKEKEEELKLLHDEANKMFPKKEEVPLGMSKQKYNQKNQSKTSRNQLYDKIVKRTCRITTTIGRKTLPNELSSENLIDLCNKYGESMVQPFAAIMQEPIVEIAWSQEKESPDKDAFLNENTPEENLVVDQTIVDAKTEISFSSHSTSKVLEGQMHVLPKLNIFDTTIGLNDFDIGDVDDDPILKLASLISMDDEVSASKSTQTRNKDKLTEEEVERGSTIKKAMMTLSECFQIDLLTIHSSPDIKAKLEQAIQLLQSVTAKDDITIGCKSFVHNLAQYLPIFWEQLSKVPEVKSKHDELVQRKQDLSTFSKAALVKRQQFIEKCFSANKARDENLERIQALEQQIANLQVELRSCQHQHLELECSFKQVNEERIQFNLKAKQAVDDFTSIKDLLKNVENELQETLSAEALTKLQWRELQKIFNNSLKKFMD